MAESGERSEPHSPNPQPPSHRLFNPAPPVALLTSDYFFTV